MAGDAAVIAGGAAIAEFVVRDGADVETSRTQEDHIGHLCGLSFPRDSDHRLANVLLSLSLWF